MGKIKKSVGLTKKAKDTTKTSKNTVNNANVKSKKTKVSFKTAVANIAKKINKLGRKKYFLFAGILIILCIIVFLVIYGLKKDPQIFAVRNESDSLAEERCVDDICVKDLNLYYQKDLMTVLSANMLNKGEKAQDACVKIRFRVGPEEDDTVDFDLCYFDLEPNKESDFETYYEPMKDDDYSMVLVYSQSYSLEKLDDKKIAEIKEAVGKSSDSQNDDEDEEQSSDTDDDE